MALNQTNPNELYAGGMRGTTYVMSVCKSTDGGNSWIRQELTSTEGAVNTIVIHPDNSNILFAGGYYKNNFDVGAIFKSINGGASWFETNQGTFGISNYVNTIAIDPHASNTMYVGCAQDIFKSTDGGATWNDLRTGLIQVCSIIINSQSPNLIYAATKFTGIFMSTNAGQSWSAMNAGLKSLKVECLAFDPINHILYAGTYGSGVFCWKSTTVPVELSSFSAISKDNCVELNWTTVSETNNIGFNVERSKDKINFEKIGFIKGHQTSTIPQNYAFIDPNVVPANYFYRLKQIDADGTFEYSNIISVEVMSLRSFRLEQNYPNPFNSFTTIGFYLAQEMNVRLKIYDIQGKEIETLINDLKPAGYHELHFDGSHLVSGIYFYELETKYFKKVGKMLLME